jgi:hypothetical protein
MSNPRHSSTAAPALAVHSTVALLLALVVAACNPRGDGSVVTLYRSSSTDASMRIHVATFDATEGTAYNLENSQTAAEPFGRQRA